MHSRLLLFPLPTMRVVSIALITTALLLALLGAEADIRRECRKQTGVSWGGLKKLRAGNFQPEDRKLKCYIKCFLQKNGIFGETDIDIDKTLRHLPWGIQGSSRKILERCKKIPSRDTCDKAFQILKCYHKAEPQILKIVAFV
ncbi:general odorant-binding protein 56d [Fopius arisanus]|uniref:General odorant-binding protein 56d n=1 Tax=Fopius arisanus TaxID=64838 RepID=A0A0C9QC14_9HYME|nr:PREDICTED: general odorant-binding protein 56d-like [Fopius arisanus]